MRLLVLVRIVTSFAIACRHRSEIRLPCLRTDHCCWFISHPSWFDCRVLHLLLHTTLETVKGCICDTITAPPFCLRQRNRWQRFYAGFTRREARQDQVPNFLQIRHFAREKKYSAARIAAGWRARPIKGVAGPNSPARLIQSSGRSWSEYSEVSNVAMRRLRRDDRPWRYNYHGALNIWRERVDPISLSVIAPVAAANWKLSYREGRAGLRTEA
jgi:hypothetical protein